MKLWEALLMNIVSRGLNMPLETRVGDNGGNEFTSNAVARARRTFNLSTALVMYFNDSQPK